MDRLFIKGTVMERISNAMARVRKVLALQESFSAKSPGSSQNLIVVLWKGEKARSAADDRGS